MEGYYPFNSNKKLQWPKRSSWRLIYLQLSYGCWWHFGKSSTHFIIMLISKYSCTLISCSNGFQGKNKFCLFYRWNSVSAFIENIKKLFEAGLLECGWTVLDSSIIQLNLAIPDVKGPTNLICHWQISHKGDRKKLPKYIKGGFPIFTGQL